MIMIFGIENKAWDFGPFLESFIMSIHKMQQLVNVGYGNTGCGVFKREGTKLERFLHKNQHTQRKFQETSKKGLSCSDSRSR